MGVGMTWWREHSPPTKVARARRQTRRHTWVEFVGSPLCSEIFFSASTLVFPSPQKLTFGLN